MSETIAAACDTRGVHAPATAVTGPPGAFPRKRPAASPRRVDRSIRAAAARPFVGPFPGRCVREDPEDYLADLGAEDAADAKRSRAADKHTKLLRKAQRDLDEARNLLLVLIASIEEIGDSRAVQAETVLGLVRKKLDKAHTRIDRQAMRHREFFLKHVDPG